MGLKANGPVGLRSAGRSPGFSGAGDPDTIVICDYGDVSAEQKKKFLLSYAPLRNVSAVKHRRIFVLDYVDLVESPRNPSAVARLGAYLRTGADS